MKTYEIGQNFDVVVSTKATLLGAASDEFSVVYAPTNNLTDTTSVAGGMSEAVESIATAHTATVNGYAPYGATYITVDSGHDVVSGDVIEYATGKYVYVTKATATKLYLRTKLRASVADGATLTQVGNTGVYVTPEFAIQTEGEFLVTIESPEHGIIVEERIRTVDSTVEQVIDPDAPVYSDVAVAY
jgi:hypothetical protein